MPTASTRRILNVGCGEDTYGTDFVDRYPRREAVLPCHVDAEPLPFPDGTFDEVYTENLFEHLVNPGRLCQEAHRVLKPGGRFVVVTDNATYWGWSVAGTHYGGYEGRSGRGSEDRHYALFTSHHLRNHLERAEFRVVDLGYEREEAVDGERRLLWLKRRVDALLARVFPRVGYPRVRIVGEKPG